MNKENKKMAQERRAQERESERRKAKIRAVLPVVLIVAAAIIAAVAFFVSRKGAGSPQEQSEAKAGQAAAGTVMSEASAGAAMNEASAGAAASGETEDSDSGSVKVVEFDASALKGCYDISGDDLTYVQIKVKDYGTITAALDGDIAPVSVDNFVSLAKDGFYDGLTFHRIIDGFMMQGGDPSGNGTGGSGKNIKGEFEENNVENPITHVRGAVSMARSQAPDSASSQFFIVQSDSTFLDGKYAGFGYVTDGMEIVDQICKDAKPTDENGSIAMADQPVIESVTVIQ